MSGFADGQRLGYRILLLSCCARDVPTNNISPVLTAERRFMYRQPRPISALFQRVAADLSQARRGLIVAKLYYFCFFGAIGCLAPFLNIYLQRQGISGAQLGWLNSIPPLIALAANPFWGALADRWQIHRLVLALCVAVTAAVSLGFLWLHTFWLLMPLVILFAFFRTPIAALLDSTVVDLIKHSGATYGRQRMWGSVGFVLTSYGLGQLLVLENLRPVFWIHAGILGAACVVLSLLLPIQGTGQRVNIAAGLRSLTRQRGYVHFLGAVALLGAGMSGYVNFLGLNIVRLGGNEAQVGLAWAANGFVEIPMMFFGAQLLAGRTPSTVLMWGFLGFGLNWLLISFATVPAHLILCAAVNGLCFATFWMAVVAYVSAAAPPGLGATAQALVGAAQAGLGWGVGAVVMGYLWDYAGPRGVFWFAAAAALAAIGIFWLGNRQLQAEPSMAARPGPVTTADRSGPNAPKNK